MTKRFSLNLIFSFLVIMFILLLIPKTISGDSHLILNGAVFNKTLNDNYMPSNNEVVLLHIIYKDKPVKTFQSDINQNGTFIFSIPFPEKGSKFLFSFNYHEVTYTTESLYLEERNYSQYIHQIEIFEIHQDLSQINFGESVMVVSGIDVNSQILQIFERVEIINQGLLTYLPDFTIPSEMNFLRFSLPETAFNITFEGDLTTGDVLQVDKGFALRNPILPGKYELSYFYQLPYESEETAILKSFRSNTDSFKVLIPTWIGGIESEAFSESSVLTIDGETFYFGTLSNISDGNKIEIVFNNLKTSNIYLKIKNWINGSGSYTLVLILFSITLVSIFVLLIYKGKFSKNRVISNIPEDISDEYFDNLMRKIVSTSLESGENNQLLKNYKGDISEINEILLLMFFRKHSFLIKEESYEQDT